MNILAVDKNEYNEVENALRDKALSGNVPAIIFWLKNQNGDKWSDKPETNDIQEVNIIDDL